jgi:hypothetical protein
MELVIAKNKINRSSTHNFTFLFKTMHYIKIINLIKSYKKNYKYAISIVILSYYL